MDFPSFHRSLLHPNCTARPSMQSLPPLGPVFVALAVIFLSVAVRDYLTAENKMTSSRQAWLRVAFIFAGVGIALYVVQTLFRMMMTPNPLALSMRLIGGIWLALHKHMSPDHWADARECDFQPTFKGVWSRVVNFAPLPPPDTRPGQYPRRHRRADDNPGYHVPGG